MRLKQVFIPLRIGKGLLCLLALFTMLLAPQGAWAQTDYGLTVAGVTVTSDNATNITGQNILAGTVKYEDGSHTLTLDHATINGSVVVTGGFDLVVCLVGNNTIQGTGETSLANGISRGGGSAAGKLTFDIAKNTSGSLFFPYVTTPIAGFANIEYLNGLEWGCRDEGTTTDYVEGVGTEVVLASIGASLYVTKTKTTMTLSNNGGTVTYRKDDTLGHVLTLSGLTDLNNCISWYSPDDVKIEISGTNNSMSFSSSGTYNSVCFEGKPQSNISFIFTGSTATLKMYDRSQYKSLEHPWISGFRNASNPTLSDGLKMVEIDEYRYDNNQSLETYVERYITTETYGLNVQGIQVHHLDGVLVGHKDNILGLVYNEQSEKWELSTSVTFNSDDNILTLNNANINYDDGNAIVSSITSPLTVHLTGENFISSGDYLPFVGAIGDNANLVFTTNTTGTPGSLTMTSTHTDFGPTSFFDGFKQILYPEEQGSLSAKSVDGNVVISQETGYGLKVAGIVVTEDNASHILGENNTTVTFTPATAATDTEPAKPATLTLNNATISGIIETSIDLTVDFKGSSTIILPTDKEYPFVGNNSPVLSFTNSGKNSTPLTVNGEFNGGYSKFMTGFANGSVDVDSECGDNTVWWLQSEISAHMYLRWIQRYDLWIGNKQFTNIDSELSGGKGSFDGDHTLTLNGASLTAPIKSNLDNLTIKLKGNNSIVETSDSATLINSYKKTATLSFDVDNELGGSLTLTNRGDGATIKNFASVSLAEGLYIHSSQPGLCYETVNDEKCYVAQQSCESWTMIINQSVSYPIWVYKNSTDGYIQITETNQANVLGEQTETKSVTYNNGTLTLNGATINSGSSYAFVMGDNMTALNVVLVGENTVSGNGFQFTSSSASLTFKTNGTDAGSFAIVNAQDTNYSFATTGTTITCENGLVYDAGTKTVGALSAPTFLSNWNGTTGKRMVEIQGQSQGTVKYSLTYADSKLSANNVSNQEYSEAFKLLGPATIKATVTVNDVVSPEATAYYFGILPNPLTFVYDGQTAPTFTATLYPSVDGVTFTPSGSPGDFVTLSDGNMTITGFGSGKASALINAPETRNFTILTDTIGFMMEVVPPAPTISSTATLEGDEITITAADGLTDPQIYYSWDSNDNVGTLYNAQTSTPTAKNGTLYAWVKMNDCTSSKAEQTFSVKKNIANAYVQMNDFYSDYVTSYTGAPITPEFVVKESESDDAPTIASTNYDVTYKYKSKTDEVYSDADEIMNVGDYKIVITGKGEAYGGSQEIEFQVEKASVTEYAQWASPAAKEDLTYTGEEQELVTAGTVPTGVTIKYYVAESAEADPYQEDGGWSEVIPKRQEIDTYYIFCKADESENYEAWPAEGEKVYLTVSIERGTATLTATNQISEYTGEPIEYSMDHVTVNPSTISKKNVGIDYYMPNSDSPLEVAPTQVGTYIVRFYLEDANYSLGEEEYTATLTITPKNITADMVTLSEESYTYDGSTHTPTVGVGYTVGQTTKTLTGADYDISYQLYGTTTNVENPTDADTYNVVVTGKGNYSGTATKSFAINPASIEDYTVSVDATQTYTYTGSAIRPSVTVNTPTGGLFDATNYTVSYENNVNAANENATNKPTVIVTGIGNYTGTTTASYTIGQADLADVTIATIANQVYTGSAIEPAVSVTLNSVAIDASEYTVGYSNNTAAGEATVTLTSNGKNFTTEHTKSTTFTILNRTLAVSDVTFNKHWSTFYSANETLELPTGVGAFVITSINQTATEATAMQISNIPAGVVVLLNDETNEPSTAVFGTDVKGNYLQHATVNTVVDAEEGDFYGLYNGAFMRITDKSMIPAGRNYLLNPFGMTNGPEAPQLTIVIEGDVTGVNEVRSKMEDVRGDFYDMQGRKVQKPSKKGLYISNGRKVVVK